MNREECDKMSPSGKDIIPGPFQMIVTAFGGRRNERYCEGADIIATNMATKKRVDW
jgi:hypothetical protein